MKKTLGVVLAGGTSSRFGTDKTMARLGGKTLLQHVCERADPQVDSLIINRNEGLDPVLAGKFEILPDMWPGEGPLAGIVQAMEYAGAKGFALLASFPCDTPFFPADLVNRLEDRLVRTKADCCIAKQNERPHNAHALWTVSCAPALKAGFFAGMRSLRDVATVITTTAEDFSMPEGAESSDDFLNVNTPKDLEIAERRLAARSEIS